MHIGRPKSGKSTAARTLACGLSSSHETEGQPNQFFGRELATGNVVYIDYENPGRIAHHSFRGLREDGFDTRLLRLLLNEPSPISLLHGLEYIRAEANRHRPVLMVLDGLMGFARIEDLNDYAKVQPALQHLREFAVEFDCAVLLQHHGRKSGGFGGEQALGSVAIPGQVDGLLDFNFDNDGRHWVTSEALRHGEGIERTDVVMHGERMVLDEQASKRDYAQRQDERRHDLLAKVMEKGTATLSDFRTGFGRRESYRPMLEQMCRDGTLVQLGKAHDRTDPVRFAVA